jgi:hypothetical protein
MWSRTDGSSTQTIFKFIVQQTHDDNVIDRKYTSTSSVSDNTFINEQTLILKFLN